MKMTKKIMLGVVAAAAIVLTGCADLAGAGKDKGSKNNKTVIVDATENAAKPLAENAVYRRYMKQIGSSEKIAAIKTTITVKDEDCIFEAGGQNAKIGFAWEMNKSWDDEKGEATKDTADSKLRDFYLFGFSTTTKKAYVEHYSKVNFDDEFDTKDSAIGVADATPFGNGAWAAVPNGSYTHEDGVWTFVVEVKQDTDGKYAVYLGGQKLCDCDGTSNFKGKLGEIKNKSIGGVSSYVNCPKGTKMVVNYATENDDVVGSLFADEE